MEMLVPIISILSCIALPIGFGMYLGLVSLRNRREERMELIKQGIVIPPDDKSKPAPNKYRALRNGFLCIGLGIGIGLGLIVGNSLQLEEYQIFIAMGALVLLFLGIAYVLFYLCIKNKKDMDSNLE